MKSPVHSLPWQQLMEITYGVLGFSPEVFWKMTPVEWMVAFSGWQKKHGLQSDNSANAISRKELNMLAQRFTDEPECSAIKP